MQRRPLDVERELDEVIGPYEPHGGRRRERWGRLLARALLGACLAVAAVTIIVVILHTNLREAQTAPPPPRPVTVQILPAR